MASAGFYCPKPDCNWEGLTCPPGQACPRCSFAVEACEPSGMHPHGKPKPRGVVLDENGLNQPASTNYVLDRELWANAIDKHKSELLKTYEEFALRLARMVTEKQLAYGDSFRHTRKVLAILYPNGVSVEQYGDLLTITRIIDKLFRVANQKDYGGESPYEDIVGYATRAACEDEEGVASTPNNKVQEPIDLAGGR